MTISSLGYIGFEVKNFDPWRPFFEDWLGLMRSEENERAIQYRMDQRSARIFLEEGEADDIGFIGFEVASFEDLASCKDRLDSLRIPYSQADPEVISDRGVTDMITLTDPSGIRIEVYVGPKEVTNIPFRSPAGVSAFVTGGQGLGHVVLAAQSIDAMRAFYQKAFGFKLSDTIAMPLGPDTSLTLEFYHCNPRHHTLALVGMDAPKKLNHFMVEMATLDDVGYAIDRLEACGVEMFLTLGKHSNDEMVSFYATTPAGFSIEVGYGGLSIDDREWIVRHHHVTSMWGHKIVSAQQS